MDDLKWALDGIRARQLDYANFANYYYGTHKLTFATDKMRNAFGATLAAFADNLCPVVVDTVADRLQVASFGSPDENEAISELCADIWQRNRMDRRSGETHAEALRTGDAFVVVWPNEAGLPRIHPNAGNLCTVEYDPDESGLITKGAKLWYDTPRAQWRFTLYYPDRIEKYAWVTDSTDFPSSAGSFKSYQVAGEPWPLPNIYGRVPLFHFANNAPTGGFGRSELADVIPLQDGLNKANTDMLVAMEFVALPQRWATGIETDLDEATGQPRALFVPGADRIWTVGAPDARFGEFSAANLGQFVAVQEGYRMEIARVSRTPLHHLMPSAASFPSGEAQKVAEQPLLAKVRDRQIGWGNVWEDVLTLALAMSGVPDVQLSCTWVDTAPRNEETQLKVLLLKKQIGVSDEQLLREAGYDADQIAQFAEEKQAALAEMGAQMLTAFDRDTPPDGVTERDTQDRDEPR